MDRSELARELERLHTDCWGWALACCRRDHALAEDALQTAYLRILSGKARFAGRSKFRTWVFGVIRLTTLETLRRQGAQGGSEDERVTLEHPDPALPADQAAELSEQAAALVVALGGLSPRQQEVLHLVFYQALTLEEAAHVMQISVGSARTHYDRGKKALAARLSQEAAR
jgi:RNA polymerase sigma factor (sigma-70 family)